MTHKDSLVSSLSSLVSSLSIKMKCFTMFHNCSREGGGDRYSSWFSRTKGFDFAFDFAVIVHTENPRKKNSNCNVPLVLPVKGVFIICLPVRADITKMDITKTSWNFQLGSVTVKLFQALNFHWIYFFGSFLAIPNQIHFKLWICSKVTLH